MLKDEPLYLQQQRKLTSVKTTELNKMLAYIDALKEQILDLEFEVHSAQVGQTIGRS